MSYYICLLDKGRQTEVSVANSKEEFKNTRVEKIEIKIDFFICPSEPCPLFYKGKRLDRNRTLGSYGIKHKDVICKEYRNSDQDLYGVLSHESKEKEKDKTQSMDNLALMQQTEPEPNKSCSIL